MAYYIDDERVSLDDLRRRIEETDLVPSRAALLEGIEEKFHILKGRGITTFARLRAEMKNNKRLEALSCNTGIDAQYLILLRREIESYLPKSPALKDFDWLAQEEIAILEAQGIRDARALFENLGDINAINRLAQTAGIDPDFLEAFLRLVDLTRVQWVSPITARVLVEAGYDSAAKLAAANADELCEAFQRVNSGDRFFKGKVGLRDIKRLVRAAGYVP